MPQFCHNELWQMGINRGKSGKIQTKKKPANTMYSRALIWCWREESNLRPTRYECVALPTELLQQKRGRLFQFRIETITVLASSSAPDETTSHSTRLSKDASQVAGYSRTCVLSSSPHPCRLVLLSIRIWNYRGRTLLSASGILLPRRVAACLRFH